MFNYFLKNIILLITLMAGLYQPLNAGDKPGFSTRKLSDNVLVMTTSDRMENNVIALHTNKGIIIIDSTSSPELASLIKKEVEKAFYPATVQYVINTHSHGDHTYGNQIFSDATIIGHENCVKEMKEGEESRLKRIAMTENAISQMKAKLSSMDAKSESYVALKEKIHFYENSIKDISDGFILTPPDRTFKDSMVLDLGDMTLQLSWFGYCHSRSDIIIYCPEEKLLLTGDLIAPGHEFYLDSDRVADLEIWKNNLKTILKNRKNIIHIVPGHGEYLQMEEIEKRHNFVVRKEASYKGKLPGVKLFTVKLEKDGMAEAVKGLEKLKNNPERFFLFYQELDQISYKMMLKGNLDDAILLMKELTELYPGKYLAFDSLGEAYMKKGNKEQATIQFQQSLKLNPENHNAKNRLKELKN